MFGCFHMGRRNLIPPLKGKAWGFDPGGVLHALSFRVLYHSFLLLSCGKNTQLPIRREAQGFDPVPPPVYFPFSCWSHVWLYLDGSEKNYAPLEEKT
jgi:hypothetical protein